MSYDIKNQDNEDLFEAFLALESKEECYKFFEDLMTIKELESISQRWQVAKMLDNGCTYAEIAEKTKASAATISRVNKCLSYGADGYSMMLRKLKK